MSDLCRTLPCLDARRIRDWMVAKRLILVVDNLAATGNAEWDLTFARLPTGLPGP